MNRTHHVIDDRSSGKLQSSNAGEWRLITDRVMGGVSDGQLYADEYQGKPCLMLRGLVSTDNNGGFIQAALEPLAGGGFDASAYSGIELQVAGNDERYNMHLRTSNLWLPWQSYRAEFIAGSAWRTVRLPFSGFQAYRTSKRFDSAKLVRIGVVAIGRDFEAGLCIGGLSFYRDVE